MSETPSLSEWHEHYADALQTRDLQIAVLKENWDRCFNSRATFIRENAELKKKLAAKELSLENANNQIERLRESNKWIPVADANLERGKIYVFETDTGSIEIGKFEDEGDGEIYKNQLIMWEGTLVGLGCINRIKLIEPPK